ncbi:MAG: NAD(P)H-dependent oxidoreductase [Moorea sp. SIOASIH]|uniref:NADPH-dependent FMN reductase n=1 Tax=Moorena sp. SIOASIH TaxID=2607817 RepID=UPI0013BAFBB2|nr:NAD(P)H-dependent oxidoreductase [Moorena sp. SIOASIH]NEO38733.1 NAD(P)H-dependent oxidoreductase [Moorena sp. SIOASIH]
MEQSNQINLKIPILLGSCRTGRQSLKVAQFIFKELSQNYPLKTEIIDLAEYNIPMLEERLKEMEILPPDLSRFCSKLTQADGILIVAPEYKNGYPGVLKNALDYLEPQALRYKPIGICTVSSGGFGGLNCLAQLRLVCLALGGLPIPDKLPISHVKEMFDINGNLSDLGFTTKLNSFIKELIWYTEAIFRSLRESSEP